MSDQFDAPIQPDLEPAEPAVGAGMPPAEPASDPAAEATAAPGPTAGEAWDDVVAKLSELSDAIGAWARAAGETPENRRHVEEVRNGVNDMARQANEAFATVSSSDFGRQVAEGATQMGTTIGETAQEFGKAAAPYVATAFAGLADAFGRGAQKVSEAAAPPKGPDPDARPAPEPPASGDATPMPASPPEDEPGE